MNTHNLATAQQVVTDILALASQLGATSSEASVNFDTGLVATTRLGKVDAIEFNQGSAIGITVYQGTRSGNVSTTDIAPQSLKNAVQKALTIAKYTQSDPCSGLADPDLLANQVPDLDLHHPSDITAKDAIETATVCEEHALKHPLIINSEGATFSTQQAFTAYGNSHGFLGSYPSTKYYLSCCAVGKKDDTMQRDHYFTTARKLSELLDPKLVGNTCAEKTVQRLGATKLKTRQAPVLFTPETAVSLLSHFVNAISGSNLYRQASFLLNSLDSKIFPSHFNAIEFPHKSQGIASAAFDNEGVATKQQTIVADGVLNTYLLGSYSARKLNMQTTGHAGGVHNLTIQPGKNNLEQLITNMSQGLLVTELMGHGVNIVTGDYSKGACGFWVENGKIAYPVEEITIAGNLKDMFANIIAVGNDLDYRSSIATGSLLVEQMTIAGN